MSLDQPPTYSPSAAVPDYSVAPGPSERTLAATARTRRRRPTGVFVQCNGLISVALRGQEDDAELPVYGRTDAIRGDVGLSCTRGVQSVHVQVEGRLHLANPEGASMDVTFFGTSNELWTRPPDDVDSDTCPCMFAFEIVLPEMFTDERQRQSFLPPSFDVPYSDTADIRAQCSYQLRVVVERKGSRLSLWNLSKKLIIPFAYHPRTRAPRPILPSPFPFLSTIKTVPEEWFQITSTINPKVNNSDIAAIDVHLFIPVAQTFALADKIPFYLQLIAPPKSLQAFLYPTLPAHMQLKRSKSAAAEATALPTVRVYLLRQVIIVIRGQPSVRSFSIGEGKLRYLSPSDSPSLLRARSLDDGLNTIDYEGEVQPNVDVTSGQFCMSGLQVRDFITTYLVPPNPWTSPLCIHQHSQPILLVTDRFAHNAESEAQAL